MGVERKPWRTYIHLKSGKVRRSWGMTQEDWSLGTKHSENLPKYIMRRNLDVLMTELTPTML